MTDYAATPFQPIVQGVVTFPGGAPNISFDGEGVSDIERLVGFPLGAYVLTLDEGLPGNAGAVPPGTTLIADPNVRTMINTRGALPLPIPNIVNTAVLYLNSPVLGVGANQILVVMQTFPAALADPTGGFEIIVWRVL